MKIGFLGATVLMAFFATTVAVAQDQTIAGDEVIRRSQEVFFRPAMI